MTEDLKIAMVKDLVGVHIYTHTKMMQLKSQFGYFCDIKYFTVIAEIMTGNIIPGYFIFF